MSIKVKFKAFAADVAFKVMEKLCDDLKIEGTYINKQNITNQYYIAPTDEQLKKIVDEKLSPEQIEEVVEDTVKKLLPVYDRLISLSQEDKVREIVNYSTSTALGVVTLEETIKVTDHVEVEIEPAHSDLTNGETGSTIVAPSHSPPKKPWSDNGETMN